MLVQRVEEKKRENFLSSIQNGRQLSLQEIRTLNEQYRQDYVNLMLQTDEDISQMMTKAHWEVMSQIDENEELLKEIREILHEVQKQWKLQ